MGGLRRLWLSRNSLEFVDPLDGVKSRLVIIPGIEIYEPAELEEILLWQESQEQKWMAEKRVNPKVPMSKQDQHDLGDLLSDIKASKKHRIETGHGRYF